MQLFAIGFIVGIVVLVNQTELPNLLYAWVLLPVLLMFFMFPPVASGMGFDSRFLLGVITILPAIIPYFPTASGR